jgi:hypothetical protein
VRSRQTVGMLLLISGLTLAAAPDRIQPPPIQSASLVLTNGKVITVEDTQPEAQAIAVRGDRIAAIGSNADVQRFVGPATEVLDLKGQLVIPGFVEGHAHFMATGEAQLDLKLMPATSWEQIVQPRNVRSRVSGSWDGGGTRRSGRAGRVRMWKGFRSTRVSTPCRPITRSCSRMRAVTRFS